MRTARTNWSVAAAGGECNALRIFAPKLESLRLTPVGEHLTLECAALRSLDCVGVCALRGAGGASFLSRHTRRS